MLIRSFYSVDIEKFFFWNFKMKYLKSKYWLLQIVKEFAY